MEGPNYTPGFFSVLSQWAPLSGSPLKLPQSAILISFEKACFLVSKAHSLALELGLHQIILQNLPNSAKIGHLDQCANSIWSRAMAFGIPL